MTDAMQNQMSKMRKPRVRICDFLLQLPGFEYLGSSTLARIASGTSEVDAPRGTLLFKRGDPSNDCLIVLFGQVKLSLVSTDGNEKVVEVAESGSHIGEAEMFLCKPRRMTAEAISDSKLLRITRETVLGELHRDPGFSEFMIQALSSRLYQLVVDLESHTLLSGSRRVIDYLLGRGLQTCNGTRSIMLYTKKGIIASQLNLTHEHFSRILHQLIAADLITVDGREVRILDERRLRDFGN
jgi:CRP/FNR family transcriptional regulator, dissimilatory nitrate respiration regulator